MVFSATSASAALGDGRPDDVPRQAGRSTRSPALVAARSSRSRFDYHRAARRSRRCCSSSRSRSASPCSRSAPPINGARRWFLARPGRASSRPSSRSSPSASGSCALSRAAARAADAGRADEAARPRRRRSSAALILLEPDLGTTIALVPDGGGHPARLRRAAAPASRSPRHDRAGARAAAAIWIEPYRRARLLSFLDPWQDPQGAGFQIVQAMIGIGSGGITGEGLGAGRSRRSTTCPRRTRT